MFENTPIEELDLMVRSYVHLKRSGINTINQLSSLSTTDLLKVIKLTRTNLKEIYFKLGLLGYSLLPFQLAEITDEKTSFFVDSKKITSAQIKSMNNEIIDFDNPDVFEDAPLTKPITSCLQKDCEFYTVCQRPNYVCLKNKISITLLNFLPSTEYQMLNLFFGLSEPQPKTHLEISSLFSTTAESVRRTISNALRTLRMPAPSSKLKTFFPVVFSTIADTPYSTLFKTIWGETADNLTILKKEVLCGTQQQFLIED